MVICHKLCTCVKKDHHGTHMSYEYHVKILENGMCTVMMFLFYVGLEVYCNVINELI